MNSLIESLNVWGARFCDFALPILWQSSLLIVVIFAIDLLLRRKIRPAVRYTLWFVVFIKLLIPPTLALPTSAAWWLRTRRVEVIAPQPRTMTVSYTEPDPAFVLPQPSPIHYSPPTPQLSRPAWLLLASICVSALLSTWSVFRWRQIARCVQKTATAGGGLQEMFSEIRGRAGVRKIVRLQLTGESMSPAVCGLFRPVVLLPQSLIERLDRNQLRAVLLHELIHLRRHDVWVNCAQTLLQIVYWWHPLLWFANARIRRVREEAVDDAVMFALSEEAEIYAPTLLEVAKLAFNRPLATLGLVGILESRNALRHRIERLLNFTAPRKVGVSAMSVLGIAAFTALAVPMGEPPARTVQSEGIADSEKLITYHAKVNPAVFIRNVQARAAGTMHTTNDDLTDILASILDGFGVDCTPPRNIAFDPAAGDVTMENTSEALQTADSIIRELNLAGGEDVLNPPYGLKQVLVVAQFYRMRTADFSQLHLDSSRSHNEPDMSPWWELTTNELDNFRQDISTVRAENISSPRIQTSHGVTAALSIGDKTNGIEFECVPYIHNGSITLTALARTTGNFAPEGGWPDFAGRTNCAIFSRFEIPDGGAVVLRAEPAGTTAESDLVILLRANTVEPTRSKDKVPFLGDLPGVGRLFRSPSNQVKSLPPDALTNLYTVTLKFDSEALTQRLTDFATEHNLNGLGKLSLLSMYLDAKGVYLDQASYFYREELGHANLTLRATREQLRKTMEALGLNATVERALNEGKPVNFEKLRDEEAKDTTAVSGTAGYTDYKTNTTDSAEHRKAAELVQAGKLLYEFGKLGEAQMKFDQALAIQPDNQAARYYLGLTKEQQEMQAKVDAALPKLNTRTNILTSATTLRDGMAKQSGPENDAPARIPNANPDTVAKFVHTNTSPERQNIYKQLNNVMFNKISYRAVPLADVVRDLTTRSEEEGINFFINRAKPMASPGGQPLTFDPATGQPIITTSVNTNENVDLAAVTITLDPGLKNVRLLDALEAITKSANHPIKYSLLDYGIEFSFKGPDIPELHTRTFKLDPNTFYTGLQHVSTIKDGAIIPHVNTTGSTGGGGSQSTPQNSASTSSGGASAGNGNRGLRYVAGLDQTAEIQLAVINFFTSIGVNMVAPKSVFFNDRQGTLTVHATAKDLDLIEQAINTLNIAPPQVTIKVRFLEVNWDDAHPLGFNWYLGNFLMNNHNTLATKGTNTSPASSSGAAKATQNQALASVSGILAAPQFKVVLRALEDRGRADLLSEGEVTTLSGRQANFQIVDVTTVVNGINATATNNAMTYNYQTTNMSFGSTLDIVPYVTADGESIQMTITPKVTEFLGYEDPKDYVKYDERLKHAQLPLIKSRIRQMTTSAIVRDGQTLVLGNVSDEFVVAEPNGTKVRQTVNDNKKKKQLIIFITPTITDPTGNRVHSKDYYDFPQVY